MSDDISLRDLVFQALDNAANNGYGDEAKSGDVGDLAINLLDYDADIFAWEARKHADDDQIMVADLIPLIEEWRRIRQGENNGPSQK